MYFVIFFPEESSTVSSRFEKRTRTRIAEERLA